MDPTLHGLVHEFLLPTTGRPPEDVSYLSDSKNPVRATPSCARFADVEVTVGWADVFARLLPHLLAYDQWRDRLLYRLHAD